MESNTNLNDRIAAITGAGKGLGRAVALKLAAAGARVVACSRTAADLNALVDEIRSTGGTALAVPADVGTRAGVDAMVAAAVEAWGPINILVNNAGLGWYKPLIEYTPEEIDQVLDVNLRGVIHACHAVLPAMIEAGGGQILNIASDLGRRAIPKMAAYVAAKHGVMGFAGSLVREVKDQGVKVMTLTPGIIDTWFGGGQPGTREETWAMKPEVVADVVCNMLCQPQYVMMDEVAIHPMHQEM